MAQLSNNWSEKICPCIVRDSEGKEQCVVYRLKYLDETLKFIYVPLPACENGRVSKIIALWKNSYWSMHDKPCFRNTGYPILKVQSVWKLDSDFDGDVAHDRLNIGIQIWKTLGSIPWSVGGTGWGAVFLSLRVNFCGDLLTPLRLYGTHSKKCAYVKDPISICRKNKKKKY